MLIHFFAVKAAFNILTHNSLWFNVIAVLSIIHAMDNEVAKGNR